MAVYIRRCGGWLEPNIGAKVGSFGARVHVQMHVCMRVHVAESQKPGESLAEHSVVEEEIGNWDPLQTERGVLIPNCYDNTYHGLGN